MMKLYVCIGSACHLKGSYNAINAFQQCIEEHKLNDKIEISGTFCLGRCGVENAVSVKIEDDVFSVKPEETNEFFENEVMKRLK